MSTHRIALPVLALGLICVAGNLSCRQEEYATTAEDTVVGTPPGMEVDLTGEVEEVYGKAFRLDPHGGLINASGVLVIPPSEALLPSEEITVRIRGTVREMTVAEVEADYGLDWAEYEVDFGSEKVVVAKAVSINALAD